MKGQTQRGYAANYPFMFSVGPNLLKLLVNDGHMTDCYERADFDQSNDPKPYDLIPAGQKRVYFASDLR